MPPEPPERRIEYKRHNMADGLRRQWNAVGLIKKWTGVVAGVLAILSGLYGAVNWIDNRWAHAGDVRALEVRLERRLDQTNIHVLDGQLRDVTGRIIQLETRIRFLTPSELQYLQQLRIDAETLRAQIHLLRTRGR